MITRNISEELVRSAAEYPVVTVLGPRQSGKTTLVQMTFPDKQQIYFTDVGLAAFLLGIHTEEQAFRDPLRGNLYENLVIAEIVKGAFNKGIRPEIYFFRDSRGNEVDLLIREKGELTPVEIKSAGTFSMEFVKGLEHFQALGLKRVTAGMVLYSGEQRFVVHGVSILNPLLAEDSWETLTSPVKQGES